MTVYDFLRARLIPGRQTGVISNDDVGEAELISSDVDDVGGSADIHFYPVVTMTHRADEQASVVETITTTDSGGVFGELVDQC